MGEQEKIPCGAVFNNDVVKIQKDQVFGWLLLLKDSSSGEEEAYSIDEITDEVFEVVWRQSKDEVFPEEFREFLRQFDKRTAAWRTRKLH